jgi:ATP-dependent DNA ligase
MARAVAGRRSDAAALPNWILPQLTQLVDAAPEGDQWLHEIKYDGYRRHARLDRGRVMLLTRTGLDSHGGSQVKRISSVHRVSDPKSEPL